MQPSITNHIEIRNNRRGEPRAFLVGTRIRVQDIVSDYERHGCTAEQIAAEYPHLKLGQIHAALAYYFENQAEIQASLKSDRAFAGQMEKESEQSQATDPASDSVSS